MTLVRQSNSPSWAILGGDCRESLRTLDAGSVQTCVTSPPYFGLRDYGTAEWEGGDATCDHAKGTAASARSTLKNDGRPNPGSNNYERSIVVPYRDVCGKCGACRVDRQIGLEPTPDEFVQALVGVFREVRRVLRDDGTAWLNLGDSYCAAGSGSRDSERERARSGWDGPFKVPSLGRREVSWQGADRRVLPDLKQKDLIGIPWMVAFALRADGWYLRSDIIWHKPNPMPESVTDRPTKAHEYLFLLSKGPRYFYDGEAIREPLAANTLRDCSMERPMRADSIQSSKGADGSRVPMRADAGRGANKRSVWTVSTKPYAGAHFATFPPDLIEPCILAGSRESDTVLDPFAGSGTTGMVALRQNRSFIGCELNPAYVDLARDRIIADSPLLNTHAEAA